MEIVIECSRNPIYCQRTYHFLVGFNDRYAKNAIVKLQAFEIEKRIARRLLFCSCINRKKQAVVESIRFLNKLTKVNILP